MVLFAWVIRFDGWLHVAIVVSISCLCIGFLVCVVASFCCFDCYSWFDDWRLLCYDFLDLDFGYVCLFCGFAVLLA